MGNKIVLAIDTKSLYYNIEKDTNEGGHTATVATPLKQGTSYDTDLGKILTIPQDTAADYRSPLHAKLIGNKVNDFKIENIFVFRKFALNGKQVECEKQYCIYTKEQINPEKSHLGRIKVHYPFQTKFTGHGLSINNMEVIKSISSAIHDYSFVVTAFEYDFDTQILNFIAEIIGEKVTYSQAFYNGKGSGNKFLKLVTNKTIEAMDNKKFVFHCLKTMKDNLMFDELRLLCNRGFCNKNFGCNYAVLIDITGLNAQEIVENVDKQRYYSDVFEMGNHTYVVTNEWYESDTINSRVYFYSWLVNRISNKISITHEKCIPVNTTISQTKLDDIVVVNDDEIVNTDINEQIEEDESEDYVNINMKPVQKIYYGAPGTGKSYEIDKLIKKTIGEDVISKKYFSRVIFYPDYEYGDFVGSLCPVRNSQGALNYEFVPGPLTLMLERCFNELERPYFLQIEELNRGNAAAIFGDFFQLLDRTEDGSSKYEIANPDVSAYLFRTTPFKELFKDGSVFFPSNLNILCTMNTADQNVFVLDTAFKRRFEMHYVKIDFAKLYDITDETKREIFTGITKTFNGADSLIDVFKGTILYEVALRMEQENKLNRDWPTFAILVNSLIDLVNKQEGAEQISEDKKLGPFFVSEVDLSSREAFINKVIYYLKQDVFKYVDAYFESSFQEIYQIYMSDNADIFKILK